ncbi:DinB family protein [Flavobacterium pallidum]|uniref:DinB family protein n=1 Tax=Flavobacterium pallidum TaxID=2172098 RepID=A0A2S1SLB0_9FLAO|nr:DinB family protein [Flavobacterium pallidum]AWI27161.1 DinB family protein [Flavobacterium pallidum]
MQRTFDVTRTSRKVLEQYLDNYSLEQLNKVPPGFNNNLIWNIGHIVVVQQMLVYNLSDLPMMVSAEMVEKYKKGTRPESDATQAEVDEIRALLHAPIDTTEEDQKKGIFKTYRDFTSMSGFSMTSAEDAMEFNNYHEAMHTGIMMGIRKFI